MSFWSGVKSLLSGGRQEAKAVDFSPDMWAAINGGWGMPTKSGNQISVNTALMTTAFYRGVLVLAEGVAQLPIQIYKSSKGGRGSEPALDHPLYDVLYRRSSGLQDAFQFWRTMLMHSCATGDGVAFKNVVNGQVRELIPVRPECVSIDINSRLYTRTYDLTFERGGFATVSQSDVFHLQGPSWAPHKGLDPAVVGREALGLAQATEETHARLHANGTRPSGVLTSPVKLTKDQVEALRSVWEATFSGASNTGKMPILSGGLDFKQVGMKGVDAEHLDTRKHQIEEIARLLGVFPIMLGHAGDQTPTFASADAFLEAHVRYSLQPLFKSVKLAVETQLLTDDEVKDGYHCRVDSSELLRGSLKDRTDYYKTALGTISSPGWLSPNEVREDDGWNPSDESQNDKIFQPSSPSPGDGQSGVPTTTDTQVAGNTVEAKSTIPRTLYVRRDLLNAAEVLKWAKAQGLVDLAPEGDLHVTIAFSTKPIDWMLAGDVWSSELTVPAGGPRVVESIGTDGAVALKFSCEDLSWRNLRIRDAGASWDHDDYQPHVTLTYAAQPVDISAIEPYRGELRFGPEIFEEVRRNNSKPQG